jgi:hypothetical protein
MPPQYEVGRAMADVCRAEGCDFVVLLGDNIYEDGVLAVDDPAWQTEFELPYAGVDAPFYAILGNHDYGHEGNEALRAAAQIEYSAHSSKWHMPGYQYTVREGAVGIVALNTNNLMWNGLTTGDQAAWWPGALAEVSDAPWVLAVGHHPYRSNGLHGNAGSYGDGDVGANIKSFFDEFVCGQVDLYAGAHDHSREWLDAPDACGGTELVQSGAGAKHDPFQRAETPTFWQDDQAIGFLYVVADETSLTGRFVDADGTVAFERTITK